MSDTNNSAPAVSEGNGSPEVKSVAPEQKTQGTSFEQNNQLIADQFKEAIGEDEDEGSYVDEDASTESKPETQVNVEAAKKAIDADKSLNASQKRKLKLKVDGQEIEQEIDLSNDEELKKYLQKAQAFDKRSQELSSLKNQMDAFFKIMKENPMKVLADLGLDPDSEANKHLENRIQEMAKSPEQQEKEKMAAELEEYKRKEKENKDAKEKAEYQQMMDKQASIIESDISKAIETKGSFLSAKDPRAIWRVAQAMDLAMQKGYKDVTAADVIPVVEKQWKQELSEFFNGSNEETIEMIVGKDNLERLRKRRLANRKKAPETPVREVRDTGKVTETKEKSGEKVSFKKFFDVKGM
jgi:hypothetical protein